MLALPPQKKRSHSHRTVHQQGFTLIELLLVIAVIVILTGITFGITRGVQNAQNRTRAKAELSAIAQGLDQFKARNGDFPWVSNDAEELFQALVGWMEFTGSGTTADLVPKTTVPASGPATYVDISKLSYIALSNPEEINPEIDLTVRPTGYVFVDPWVDSSGTNVPYVYDYKTSAASTWDNLGYLLFSAGIDGVHAAIPGDGMIDQAWRDMATNIDNLYIGR